MINWDEQLKSKTLNDLVNQFCTIVSNHGWGIFNPKQISDNLIVIELQHNISNNLNNKSKYICYYITGLLAGFGEYALYKVNVTENNCNIENPGLNSCEFRIEKIF